MLRRTWRLWHYISLEQVEQLVKAKKSSSDAVRHILLVDVRSTSEVAETGIIPSAVNIPLPILKDVLEPNGMLADAEFASCFGTARPEQGTAQLVFYCAHGVRSAVACEVAEELGFTNPRNFTGSWAQWYHAHGPPTSP